MRFVYAVVLFGLIAQPLAAGDLSGVPQIVDADTIFLNSTKIRINGVDAPESDQVCLDASAKNWSCGLAAVAALQDYSRGRQWVCSLAGQDRFGRFLGSCSIEKDDVGRWLVRNGWALAFIRYSDGYVPDESFARDRKNGLWSGAFIAPWDWRRRGSKTVILGALAVPSDAQRKLISPAETSALPNPDCVIKGNLHRIRQCIYHVPGGLFYGVLNMERSASRRWFCSEAEAQAAGCRKSKL